jgi:hypothetical protein
MTVVSSWIYAGWIEAIFCTVIGSVTAIGWRATAWVIFEEVFLNERQRKEIDEKAHCLD